MTTTTGPSDALARTARVLWPAPDPPGHALRPLAVTDGTAPHTERYLAVPGPTRPRFLLPVDAPHRARARLLLAYNHLRSDRRRVQRLGLAGLALLGLPRGRRRVLAVVEEGRGDGDGLRTTIARELGVAPGSLLLSVGVRPGTGPVVPNVTVSDRRGRPRVFVKVADTTATRAHLDAEHDVLSALRGRAPGCLVPAPLFRTVVGDRLVVGIEPLPLDVRRIGPGERATVAPYLERLVGTEDDVRTLADSAWTARLLVTAEELPSRWRGPLSDAVDAAVARHGGRGLRHGLRHGDWSPWNMAWSTSAGGLVVWDWEFHEPSAPLGLDDANWVFAYDTSVRGSSMTAAARRLRTAATSGEVDGAIAELYLLDMAVRRAQQAAGGDRAAAGYADELLGVIDTRWPSG